jgi:putative membrane protein
VLPAVPCDLKKRLRALFLLETAALRQIKHHAVGVQQHLGQHPPFLYNGGIVGLVRRRALPCFGLLGICARPGGRLWSIRMKFIAWLVRILVFVLLLLLALKNVQPATLYFYLGWFWTAPLILIVLAFFVGGLVVGWLSATPSLFRHKLENGRLKRELKNARVAPSAPEQQPPLM